MIGRLRRINNQQTTISEGVSGVFGRKSIFISKQVYSYSMVFAVIVLIFFVAFYNYILITSQKISTLNQQELADKTMKQVEYFLNDMDHIAYQVMTNSQLLNTFNKLQQDENSGNYFDDNILLNIDTGSILTTINGPNRLMWRISVYNQYGDYISSGALVNKESVEQFLKYQNTRGVMASLKDSADKSVIISPEPDRWSQSYSSTYLTIRRPLMNIYSQEVYGIVEIQQDIKSLIQSTEFNIMESIGITILDQYGKVVLDRGNEKGQERHANRVSMTSLKYGWTVILSQSKEAMLAPYRMLIITVLIGSIAIIALTTVAILIIARKLSEPVIMLKDRVSQLNMQNISEHYEGDHSIDEVRELNSAFSSMLSRLSESIVLEKKAWFLALQAQMNPHFLYNSLSVISASAVEEGNDKVVMMCHELSAMLRYAASYKETTVTLKEELENVDSYLKLMKWRYEDYFEYEIAAEEEMLSMSMPKLILQPLAENCFAHAFSEVEPPYYVKITARVKEGKWTIEVCDNGCGLSDIGKKEIIDKIEGYWRGSSDKYTEMKIGGLGLINTLIRMRLNTGKDITYAIEDNTPRGLIITMRGDI